MRAFALAATACLMAGQAEAAIVTYKFYPGNMIEEFVTIYGDTVNASGVVSNYSYEERTSYPQPGKPPPYDEPWFTFHLDTDVAPKGPFTASAGYNGRDKGVFTTQYAVLLWWSLSFDENWLPTSWLIDESSEYAYRQHSDRFVFQADMYFETLIDGNDPKNSEWWSPLPRPFVPKDGYGYFRYTEGAKYNLGRFTVEGLPAPSPVPLPAAAPLLLAGTAALWAVGRRRFGESCGSRA